MPLPNEVDTEQPVIEAIRGGDAYAFGELVARHDRWVRGVIFGLLGDRDRVDDVAQQVWLTAWQRFSDLRDPTRWRCWLYRLARNASIDAGREATRRRDRLAADRAIKAQPTGSGAADVVLAADERSGHVFEAIQALPALYREPFVLRHLNEWSYKQIAEVMEMPVDTVETRLVRARRLLRGALKGKVV